MDKRDFNRFFKTELKDRWPQWEPTDTQIRDVFDWLEPYSYEQARSAVVQARQENNWRDPNLPRILELCRQMQKSGRSKTNVPAYAVFMDGMMKTFYYQLEGLLDIDDGVGQSIKDRLTSYLIAENHFVNHGRFVVFVGENNFYAACRLSEQNRAEYKNAARESA